MATGGVGFWARNDGSTTAAAAITTTTSRLSATIRPTGAPRLTGGSWNDDGPATPAADGAAAAASVGDITAVWPAGSISVSSPAGGGGLRQAARPAPA